MDDFLSRVAGRALGEARLVDPLVPSLYAPGPLLETHEEVPAASTQPRVAARQAEAHARDEAVVEPRPDDEPRGELEEPTSPRDRRDLSRQPMRAAPRVTPEPRLRPLRPSAPQAAPDVTSPDRPVHRQTPPAAADRDEDAAREVVRSGPDPPTVSSPPTQPSRPRATAPRPREPLGDPTDAPAPHEEAVPSDGSASPTIERGRRLATSSRSESPRAARAAREPAPPAAREAEVEQTREPRSARLGRPTRREAEGPSAAEDRPVHVTIGRVEVRAPAAPAPNPPPPAPVAPTMSLDEYLRTRGGVG